MLEEMEGVGNGDTLVSSVTLVGVIIVGAIVKLDVGVTVTARLCVDTTDTVVSNVGDTVTLDILVDVNNSRLVVGGIGDVTSTLEVAVRLTSEELTMVEMGSLIKLVDTTAEVILAEDATVSVIDVVNDGVISDGNALVVVLIAALEKIEVVGLVILSVGGIGDVTSTLEVAVGLTSEEPMMVEMGSLIKLVETTTEVIIADDATVSVIDVVNDGVISDRNALVVVLIAALEKIEVVGLVILSVGGIGDVTITLEVAVGLTSEEPMMVEMGSLIKLVETTTEVIIAEDATVSVIDVVNDGVISDGNALVVVLIAALEKIEVVGLVILSVGGIGDVTITLEVAVGLTSEEPMMVEMGSLIKLVETTTEVIIAEDATVSVIDIVSDGVISDGNALVVVLIATLEKVGVVGLVILSVDGVGDVTITLEVAVGLNSEEPMMVEMGSLIKLVETTREVIIAEDATVSVIDVVNDGVISDGNALVVVLIATLEKVGVVGLVILSVDGVGDVTITLEVAVGLNSEEPMMVEMGSLIKLVETTREVIIAEDATVSVIDVVNDGVISDGNALVVVLIATLEKVGVVGLVILSVDGVGDVTITLEVAIGLNSEEPMMVEMGSLIKLVETTTEVIIAEDATVSVIDVVNDGVISDGNTLVVVLIATLEKVGVVGLVILSVDGVGDVTITLEVAVGLTSEEPMMVEMGSLIKLVETTTEVIIAEDATVSVIDVVNDGVISDGNALVVVLIATLEKMGVVGLVILSVGGIGDVTSTLEVAVGLTSEVLTTVALKDCVTSEVCKAVDETIGELGMGDTGLLVNGILEVTSLKLRIVENSPLPSTSEVIKADVPIVTLETVTTLVVTGIEVITLESIPLPSSSLPSSLILLSLLLLYCGQIIVSTVSSFILKIIFKYH